MDNKAIRCRCRVVFPRDRDCAGCRQKSEVTPYHWEQTEPYDTREQENEKSQPSVEWL